MRWTEIEQHACAVLCREVARRDRGGLQWKLTDVAGDKWIVTATRAPKPPRRAKARKEP